MTRLVLQQPQEKPFTPLRRLLNDFRQQGNYSALRAGNMGCPINRLTKASSTGIPCFFKVDR
jgi:hypothetical protein